VTFPLPNREGKVNPYLFIFLTFPLFLLVSIIKSIKSYALPLLFPCRRKQIQQGPNMNTIRQQNISEWVFFDIKIKSLFDLQDLSRWSL